MSIQITVTGKPSNIKVLSNDPKFLFALEFHNSVEQVTVVNNKEKQMNVTTLVTNEQWNRLLKLIEDGRDTLADANQMIMQGEIEQENIELCTFVPNKIGYISHAQKRFQDEYKLQQSTALMKQKETKVVEDEQMKNVIFEELKKLHEKYEGVCKTCGQRCDKKVVFLQQRQGGKIIVCPDCYNDTSFSIKNVTMELQEELTKRGLFSNVQDMLSYFQQFVFQYTLVSYKNQMRTYWTWDKQQICKSIHVSNEGNVFGVKLGKKGKTLTIDNKHFYIMQETNTLLMYKIKGLRKSQKKRVTENEMKEQLQYYGSNQMFSESIIVVKDVESSRYQVIDGYAACQAARRLKLRKVPIVVVAPM